VHSARLCTAHVWRRVHVCGLPARPGAAAVAKCYRTWHAAVASLPIAARPCCSGAHAHASVRPAAGSARSYSTSRQRQLAAPRGSGSSLNAAAAARRPVTRDTHMSDHALIIDDPHVSDESLMTYRQREVLPARGTWEWYGPAPLRPSSQLSPWLHRHPLSAGQRDVLGPLACPAATVTLQPLLRHPPRLALRLARLHWHHSPGAD
jgi:hypothetical protein